MKMSRILTAIALVLVLIMTMTACELFPVETNPSTTQTTPTTPTTPTEPTTPVGPGVDPTPDHTCESVCPECGLCLNADCAEAICSAKCEGHNQTPEETTPVITVNPSEIEINAGDDIDLMFGVSVSDEGDEAPRLIIEDDDDFDAEVEGEYTITYLAVNKYGNEARATRTIKVNKALSALSLEVQKNILGEQKWTGNLLNFKNAEYVVLTGSATLDKQSGVFYNSTSETITLTVNGDYGVAAIITANGVVIEGRDGANGKLVNAANPVRSSSTASLNVNKFAEDMKIPAGGYAIVVQNGYCGTTVDDDGRGFMNWNVIGNVGNVVRLVWADSQEILTPYVDQAPVVNGHTTTVYAGSSEFVLDTEVLAGVTATDDNGTFAITDDTAVTVTIKDNGGFDINKQGKYTITLEATDGVNTTTVTRTVEVTTESVEIKINNNSYTTLKDLVAVDQDLTVLGKYLFVIYTPNYSGSLNWTNGYGVAMIINKYGEIVRIYDGASAKYFDADNAAGVQNGTCTAAGYLKEAFESRQAGEYMIVAPNANGNVSRTFLYSNRTVGAKITLPGITFTHKCESVCVQCGLCLNAECTDSACANKCAGHVHNCSAICEVCAKCGNAECTDPVCEAKCDCVTVVVGTKSIKIKAGTIAIDVAAPTLGSYNFVVYTYTFKAQNETLSWNNGWSQAFILNQYGQVVRVYDGVSGGKYFDAANRAGIVDATITTAANTLKDAYASLSEGETLILGANGGMNGNAGRSFLGGVRTIGLIATIPGVTFETLPEHTCESACADCGKCMDATCIMPACLNQCVCHRCESVCAKCNGCLDPACTEKACATKCSCHDCESLCAICGGCKDTECTNEVCAKKCVCTLTPETGKYFAVNGTYFYAKSFVYNESVNANTCHTDKIVIYDKNFTGTFTTNNHGVAVVVDGNGKLVKGYAWDGYYTAEGKAAIHYATGDYATTAFAELKPGEVLIIFANDGANAADSERTFGKSLCDKWAETMGKEVVLTGYTFSVPAHYCESVCPQCGLCLDAACVEEVCASKCAGHAHVCESTCATCSACKDAACTEDACATKCGCLEMTIGTKAYTAKAGMWAYNETITSANAANKAIWIFDSNYTGTFATNGYGVVLVLSAEGKLLRVYDGANGSYSDAVAGANNKTYGVTSSNFSTMAWESRQEGEIIVVLPNGPDGNKARQVGLDCRWLVGGKMNFVSLTYNK
jgi:hypothetical protein